MKRTIATKRKNKEGMTMKDAGRKSVKICCGDIAMVGRSRLDSC